MLHYLPAWVIESSTLISIVDDQVLTPGQSDTLCLYLAVNSLETHEATPESWTTIAEITEYTDEDDEPKFTDADSKPDDDLYNDPGGNPEDDTNDELDGDGTGDPNDPDQDSDPALDEDDNDPEILYICDIANNITTDVEVPEDYFDIQTFKVELHNQGNRPITNVKLQNVLWGRVDVR